MLNISIAILKERLDKSLEGYHDSQVEGSVASKAKHLEHIHQRPWIGINLNNPSKQILMHLLQISQQSIHSNNTSKGE